MTNDLGGINQGVCSADKATTSYLLEGDTCLLHAKDEDVLEHMLGYG